MSDSLQRLSERMMPHDGQEGTHVDWRLLEDHLGIAYPQSFKDYIAIYGCATWFDKVLPIYATPATPADVEEFRGDIAEWLKWTEGNTYDENYKELELPHYPSPGGLFPFLNDIDGPLCFWRTLDSNPDRWPVYCWMRGPVSILTNMTISDMLLGYIERRPEMVKLWGDYEDQEPHRLGFR